MLKSHRSKMIIGHMLSYKQCALPVITTMALWQLMHLCTWCTVELSRDLNKSSTYRDFEFSKSFIKTVNIDTCGFEKIFSFFIFSWKVSYHTVLNYQSAHGLTSFPCSVQRNEFCPAFPTRLQLHQFNDTLVAYFLHHLDHLRSLHSSLQ